MTDPYETCDSCGPAVKAAATIVKHTDVSDFRLSFCNHHFNRFSEALQQDHGWHLEIIHQDFFQPAKKETEKA